MVHAWHLDGASIEDRGEDSCAGLGAVGVRLVCGGRAELVRTWCGSCAACVRTWCGVFGMLRVESKQEIVRG